MFSPSLRRISAIAVTATVFAGSTAALAASERPQPSPVIGGDARAAIPGRYIVMLKDPGSVRTPVTKLAETLSARYNGVLGSAWEALTGFSVSMGEADIRRLARDPMVDRVTRDHYRLGRNERGGSGGVAPLGAQTPVTWGLDRIDQHARPLDNSYAYDDSAGTGVSVYILSSGIAAHPDFAGRAFQGPNFSGDGGGSSDCLGWGTQIAGIVAGTQHGVAKLANVVGLRIYGGTAGQCGGVINAPFSGILNAFNWAIANAARPAVLVYSVGDGCVDIETGQPVACDPADLETERNAQAAAFASGLSVVAAAGGSNADRCALDGGVAPGTFYVGATTANDTKAGFSNFGPCLNMWAPGADVATTGISGSSITASATDLAAAHVAGTVALFLGKPEFAGAGPNAIHTELVTKRSTPNVLTGIGPGSPNLLLFTGPPGFFTIGEPASLVPTPTGMELFGANSAERLQRRTGAGSGGWTPWAHSATKGWQSISGEPNADGRLALAGITPSGELWLREETAAGSNTWSNWSKLSAAPNSVPIGRVSMAHNQSNRLQIFATTHQGQAYYRSQLFPGSRQWSAWTQFSFSGKLRALTAVRQGDGRIQVLGVDDAGQVWRTTQTTPTDTNWSAFTKLTGSGVATIAAARNANGGIELVGVDAGGGGRRRTQSAAGVWSDWAALNPKTLSRLTAETGADGRVQLIGVDNLGKVWHSVQTSPGAGTYTPWVLLDGLLRP